jgi:hydrogenase expression/formation protein HypC
MCLAVPGKIITITDKNPTTRRGRVRFGDVVKEINLSFVPKAEIGEYVLVHVGFALATIQEEEAQRVFDYLEEMDELAEMNESDDLLTSIATPRKPETTREPSVT